MSFLTVSSIITWANDKALINDVMFFRGNRNTPYIKKGLLFYYFRRADNRFELVMTSERDLESFA